MITAARIKLTGALARSGRRGRVRFDVCGSTGWTPAKFPCNVSDDAGWLPVDDAVFAMAVAVLAAPPPAGGRVVMAELAQREAGSCDCETLVDDVVAMRLEPAAGT